MPLAELVTRHRIVVALPAACLFARARFAASRNWLPSLAPSPLPAALPFPASSREDFRIFDNGVAQTISYFDASTQPGNVALVIDASPSVLRDADEMQKAADALIDALAPLDQAAVVDFSAHTYLQLPFSDVRELVRRAVARVDVRALLGDTGGSNIYEAVYLAARDLFPGRTGRKAIVLLTDGQDSGLGLTLDPASASPRPGNADNRLTFDDVSRLLAAQDIQLFAVSTETRPKVMTPDWISAHASSTLLTSSARTSGIPPYTLYLAELVRRAGGQLYFLRETKTMADTFRQIAAKIRAEYTIGFSPALRRRGRRRCSGSRSSGLAFVANRNRRPGRCVVAHRADYYRSGDTVTCSQSRRLAAEISGRARIRYTPYHFARNVVQYRARYRSTIKVPIHN